MQAAAPQAVHHGARMLICSSSRGSFDSSSSWMPVSHSPLPVPVGSAAAGTYPIIARPHAVVACQQVCTQQQSRLCIEHGMGGVLA